MNKSALPAILLAAALTAGLQPAGSALASPDAEVAIRVDDLSIGMDDFEAIFRAALRQKYYHGQVPDAEREQFREQVARDIVTQQLVYREAVRRGLQPDQQAIAQGVEAYDAQYASDPNWQAQRERVMPQLAKRMERQSLLEQMEAAIRQPPRPNAGAIEDFYRANPDKFTQPEKLRGSVILLPVAPYAGEQTWVEAESQAAELRAQIDGGADFAELARQHSKHASAADGGDLGYLHRGQLDENVQQRVDALAPGTVSEPIRVLEGVILFRVDDVRPPQLTAFEEVRERAAELLYREMQDRAWNDFVSDLKASAEIYVNENLYVRSDHE
jgi:parvulin-like peptidyl-prolyl isomerase